MQNRTIKQDYHVHSLFSTDAKASPEAMCEAAIARGLTDICFTDHLDLGFDEPGLFRFDPDAYFQTLEQVKAAFAGRLKVHIGVELGLLPDDPALAREAEALVRDYPWEFVIGSTHQLPIRSGGKTAYVDPVSRAETARIWKAFGTVKALMSAYYQTVLRNLEQFDFPDTVGHIDYLSRYLPRMIRSAPEAQLPYRYEDHAEEIDRILHTAIRKGFAIEVNTGGLYKETGKTNPEDRIIRRYLALGGRKLTYGSDAHRPENLGYGFETLPDYERESRLPKEDY